MRRVPLQSEQPLIQHKYPEGCCRPSKLLGRIFFNFLGGESSSELTSFSASKFLVGSGSSSSPTSASEISSLIMYFLSYKWANRRAKSCSRTQQPSFHSSIRWRRNWNTVTNTLHGFTAVRTLPEVGRIGCTTHILKGFRRFLHSSFE